MEGAHSCQILFLFFLDIGQAGLAMVLPQFPDDKETQGLPTKANSLESEEH